MVNSRIAALRLFSIACLSAGAVSAQHDATAEFPPTTCFAPTLEEARAHARTGPLGDQSDCTTTNATIRPEYEPANGFVYKIPVVWHVIHSGNAGNINRSYIDSQMEVLNESFNAIPGTPGEDGVNARIWFYLATEDPDGNPTNGIDRVDNDEWFRVDPVFEPPYFTFFPDLAWDTNRYVNIYTKKLPPELGGAANNPLTGIVGTPDDWVVLNFRTVGRPPIRNSPPWQLGRNGTHELGHWAGLSHVFEGGCGTPNCYQSGDLLCDTNPQSQPIFVCGNSNTCGSPDDLNNYMAYTNDACRDRFTPEQVNRMRCTLDNWRPDIHRPLCSTPSSVTVRSAAPNLDAYVASPLELATELSFTIDTSTYDFAMVLSRAQPANVTLPGGQVLLLDLTSAPVCSTGLLAGPDATFDFVVPLDPELCGLSISSQALLFGGQTPFALTNAIDFVIGG